MYICSKLTLDLFIILRNISWYLKPCEIEPTSLSQKISCHRDVNHIAGRLYWIWQSIAAYF